MVLAAADLVAEAMAEEVLAGGRVIGLGVIQLRLGYNSGVAFSLGDALPAWVLIGGTGLLSVLLAAYAWRAAATLTRVTRLASRRSWREPSPMSWTAPATAS